MESFSQFIQESVLNMDKDALKRYAAMKDKGVPMYQLMDPNSNKVVSKGQDVDYYVDGNKQYGTVVSVNAKTGIAKIKNSKTKEVDEIQAYPKGVIY